jgi:pyruvate/2-oxoglutarate/acetoin dehydrogenase E1 component
MKQLTFREAIIEALRQNLKRDERVFLLGEDIGCFGGIYQCTAGLSKEFGEDRVIDSPISESAIIGAGIGAAMVGMRPVVEIMSIDFTLVCMDQIVNQAAKIHYMFGGRAKIPLVIRTTGGAGRGAGAHHAQSLHSIFMHFPGIKIVTPSTPYDAIGLLNTSIQDENPVLFIEDRGLHNLKGEVPEEYYSIPFGEAVIRHEGDQVTLVATFRMVHKALTVAHEMEKEGIGIEVIDPRTICPLDKKTIINSFKKTGKLIIVDEGYHVGNFGNEIISIIAEEAFDYIQAPIIKVTAPQIPPPYSPVLERKFIPDEEGIRNAIQRVMQYR